MDKMHSCRTHKPSLGAASQELVPSAAVTVILLALQPLLRWEEVVYCPCYHAQKTNQSPHYQPHTSWQHELS